MTRPVTLLIKPFNSKNHQIKLSYRYLEESALYMHPFIYKLEALHA